MTTDPRPFAAVLGFAFAAAWVAFGLGDAVLCLIAAGLFWLVAGVLDGRTDLADLQERFGPSDGRLGSRLR